MEVIRGCIYGGICVCMGVYVYIYIYIYMLMVISYMSIVKRMKKELGHLLGSRKDEEVGTIGVKDRRG